MLTMLSFVQNISSIVYVQLCNFNGLNYKIKHEVQSKNHSKKKADSSRKHSQIQSVPKLYQQYISLTGERGYVLGGRLFIFFARCQEPT